MARSKRRGWHPDMAGQYGSAWLNDRERIARDLQAFQVASMSGRFPDQPWSDHHSSKEMRSAHREARKLRPTVHRGIDGSVTYKVRGQVVRVVDRKGRTKYNAFNGANPFDVSDVFGLGLVSAFGPPAGDGSLGSGRPGQSTRQATQTTPQATQTTPQTPQAGQKSTPWYQGLNRRTDMLVDGFEHSPGFDKSSPDKYGGFTGYGSGDKTLTRKSASMAASHSDVDAYGRRLSLTTAQTVQRRHAEIEARNRAAELGIAYTGGTKADVEKAAAERQDSLDARKKQVQQAASGGRTMAVFRRTR